MASKKAWIATGVCAVIGVIALCFTFFGSSPEDRVKQTLGELAKIVSVKEGDTILSRTARLRSRMKEVVDDNVFVNVAELGIDVRGRRQLEDAAAKAVVMYQSADCLFTKLVIKIDEPQVIANVDGVALVTAQQGGERKIDERAIHFLLRKDDGVWRVTTIDVAPKKL